jgi:hypothetical protein
LNVGQGSATFLVVEDDTQVMWKPVAAVLVDLGTGSSNHGSKKYVHTIDFIANQLKNMAGGAKLDLLTLSHSDNDHINLVGKLFEKFSPNGTGGLPKLTIGCCVYGGHYALYKKGNVNILDTVALYLTNKSRIDKTANATPGMSTGFKFSGKTLAETKLVDVHGLSVTNLLMNAPKPASSDGHVNFRRDIEINTLSVILVATFTTDSNFHWNFIITGDATGPTLYHCHATVFGTPNRLEARLKGTSLMTVPHHGSERTATCFKPLVSSSTTPEWDPTDNFIADCQAYSAVASAGNTSHRHPRWSMLNRYFLSTVSPLGSNDYFDPNLPPKIGHFYNAYFDGLELDDALGERGNSDGYGCFATAPSMFTTFYFNKNGYRAKLYPNAAGASPTMPTDDKLVKDETPELVYWCYEVDENDKLTVTPEPFRLSESSATSSPFVGNHPVSLGAAARTTLRHARPRFTLTPLASPATRAHVLA